MATVFNVLKGFTREADWEAGLDELPTPDTSPTLIEALDYCWLAEQHIIEEVPESGRKKATLTTVADSELPTAQITDLFGPGYLINAEIEVDTDDWQPLEFKDWDLLRDNFENAGWDEKSNHTTCPTHYTYDPVNKQIKFFPKADAAYTVNVQYQGYPYKWAIDTQYLWALNHAPLDGSERTRWNRTYVDRPRAAMIATSVPLVGDWDPSTDADGTPNLSDGTGVDGTYYRVTQASPTLAPGTSIATRDLGSGNIEWFEGDLMYHTGGIWTRIAQGMVITLYWKGLNPSSVDPTDFQVAFMLNGQTFRSITSYVWEFVQIDLPNVPNHFIYVGIDEAFGTDTYATSTTIDDPWGERLIPYYAAYLWFINQNEMDMANTKLAQFHEELKKFRKAMTQAPGNRLYAFGRGPYAQRQHAGRIPRVLRHDYGYSRYSNRERP